MRSATSAGTVLGMATGLSDLREITSDTLSPPLQAPSGSGRIERSPRRPHLPRSAAIRATTSLCTIWFGVRSTLSWIDALGCGEEAVDEVRRPRDPTATARPSSATP